VGKWIFKSKQTDLDEGEYLRVMKALGDNV